MQSSNDLSRRILESSWFRWLTIVSVAVALVGLPLTVPAVREWALNERLGLAIRLDNEIPILGLRRQIEGLSVTYEGNDLVASNQDIVAARIFIENTGSKSITPANVSPTDPIGFEVKGARIVRVSRFSATSEHLRQNAKPRIAENTIYIDRNVIIDSSDSLSFDLLLLKRNSASISIEPKGKIESVKSIQFFDQSQPRPDGYLRRAFAGDIVVQIGRGVAYFLLGVMVIGLSVALFIAIENYKDRKRFAIRRKVASVIARNVTLQNDVAKNLVLEAYLRNGSAFVKYISDRMEKPVKSTRLASGRRFGPTLDHQDVEHVRVGKIFEMDSKMPFQSWHFGEFVFLARKLELINESGTPSEDLKEAVSGVLALLLDGERLTGLVKRGDPPHDSALNARGNLIYYADLMPFEDDELETGTTKDSNT